MLYLNKFEKTAAVVGGIFSIAFVLFALTLLPRIQSVSAAQLAHDPSQHASNGITLAQAVTATVTVTPTMSMEMTPTMAMTSTMTMEMTPTVPATMPISPTVPITMAMAEMRNISGTLLGTAFFTETAQGLQVSLTISDLIQAAPGLHGIHFHQVGRCMPDFALAGEHFNPTMHEHGLKNPDGSHAGDLPNIEFDAKGSAVYTATAQVTLETGPTALLDADGTALVIHSKMDDEKSDPAGWSGSRIACGVVTAMDMPAPALPTPKPPITGTDFEPEIRSATAERLAQLKVPAGFGISVFGEGLGNVRMMAQADNGTVYVTRRAQGDVLMLQDKDGDGKADTPPAIAISNLPSVHGILIKGTDIYLATPTTIWKGTLAADGTVQGATAIVNDLPEGGQHGSRTLAFGPDGNLYVSVGSPCNACSSEDPEYATILQVKPDGSSRTIFASGLRNTIGWGWHPQTGQMWGMDHGSDWRGDDQPPEELNMLVQGKNYGWPYCYGDKKVDPYLPGAPKGMTKAEFCAKSEGPALTYQAHSAPIEMVFGNGAKFPAEYQNDAFVAMRGSWNRTEAVGYKVVRINFDETGKPTAFEDFATGWLVEDGKAQFGRLAGLLVLRDGSLLITDDTNGMIYRVRYTGQ